MNTLRKSVTHLLASRISNVVSPMTSVFMITLSPNTSQLISMITPALLLSKATASPKITANFLTASTSSSVIIPFSLNLSQSVSGASFLLNTSVT